MSNHLGFLESFMLSGTAAAVSKTAAAPIERIKLLLQNQGELLKQKKLSSPFSSLSDVAIRTFRSEGLLGFWRGNFASVLRYFPQQALNFGFKEPIKSLFPSSVSGSRKLATNVLSGGLAGSLSLLFVQSIDFTRTRLALDRKKEFRGILDVYVKTLRTDGIGGLYRGFFVSCTCIFVYRGLYFGLYDSFKPLVCRNSKDILRSFLLGWIVTVTSGIIAYPIDTVRRRMMLTSGATLKYSSSLDCFLYILRNEGASSLFRGAGINVVRGVAGAGVLSGFDSLQNIYCEKRHLYKSSL